MNRPAGAPLLQVKRLAKHFGVRRGLLGRPTEVLKAVTDVSFEVNAGEVLGLVGESGSGKSTIGRILVGLTDASGGEILFGGKDLTKLSERDRRASRRAIAMVFQDPFESLNPRMTVAQSLTTPLRFGFPDLTRTEMLHRAAEAMERVGLPASYLDRFPHEFSGGQRQRIGIARALIVDPKFIVADEAVSALDVSVQAQVLNLFKSIRRDLDMTMLFIAHDLAVVGNIADRIAVIYLGRLMELAPTRTLFSQPLHPYTEALISAAPEPVPERGTHRITLHGDIPSPIDPPSGCVFRTRCRYATDACARTVPELRARADGHLVACLRDDIDLRAAVPIDAAPAKISE